MSRWMSTIEAYDENGDGSLTANQIEDALEQLEVVLQDGLLYAMHQQLEHSNGNLTVRDFVRYLCEDYDLDQHEREDVLRQTMDPSGSDGAPTRTNGKAGANGKPAAIMNPFYQNGDGELEE